MKFLIFFISISLHAGVNLKNGNFYISYTDIETTSKGKTIEVTRTYNSKSTYVGWFGYGWGTPFETKLTANLDGSVTIQENGSGGRSRFVTGSGISPVNVRLGVKEIIKKMSAKSALTEKAKKDLYARLVKDENYRSKLGNELGMKPKHKVGLKLNSFNYGNQSLVLMDKGYKRVFKSGLTQYFDREGNLVASTDRTGYRIRFNRDKVTNKVSKIFDNSGNQINIKWNADGFISQMTSTGSGKAVYNYNKKKLMSSKDVNGNKYSYGYDSYFNLTKVTDHRVTDKKRATMYMKYEPKTLYVNKVTGRDGRFTKYLYGSNDNKKLHYWTIVEKTGMNDQRYANYYEYQHKVRSDGSKWLYRTKFTTAGNLKNKKVVGGFTKETINNECCELPLKIKEGRKITEFQYNKQGLLVAKRSNDGFQSKIQYNAQGRVSSVSSNGLKIKYGYNKKGELRTAKDSKGRAISLIYDLKGKISKMVDINNAKKKRILSFKYNTMGKPSIITMDGVGKLTVKYNSFGQVKKVDSSGGRQIASQVSGAFQNLIGIVKPAGVELNI